MCVSKNGEGKLFPQHSGFIFIDNFGAFGLLSGPMSVCCLSRRMVSMLSPLFWFCVVFLTNTL